MHRYCTGSFFVFLLITFFFLAFPRALFAHVAGFPYIKINGVFADINPIQNYTTAEFKITQFLMPEDIASASGFVVNTPIQFEISDSKVPWRLTYDAQGKPQQRAVQYRWDFGDGSPQENGTQVEHSFSTPGSFFVTLAYKPVESNEQYTLLGTLQINSIPYEGYVVPYAEIQQSGKLLSYIPVEVASSFPAQESSFSLVNKQGNIQKIQWDFLDEITASGFDTTHLFSNQTRIPPAVGVRLIDDHNIMYDAYLPLEKEYKEVDPNTVPKQQNSWFSGVLSQIFSRMSKFKDVLIPVTVVAMTIAVYVATFRMNKKNHFSFVSRSKLYQHLLLNVRRYWYMLAVTWATGVYWWVALHIQDTTQAMATLGRWSALTALYLLYLTLIPGIVKFFSPKFFLVSLLIHVRRSVGVSAFLFAVLHAIIQFYTTLNGQLNTLLFLSPQHQQALMFSSIAFTILFLLFLTSTEWAVKKMGSRWWNKLHRLLYFAVIFTVIHAFFIGSHFTRPQSFIPLSINVVGVFILTAELLRCRRFLFMKYSNTQLQKVGIHLFVVVGVLTVMFFSTKGLRMVFDPHARHLVKLSDKYEAIVTSAVPIAFDQKMDLTFQIRDKKTHEPILDFLTVHEKLLHLMVVSKDLKYYSHLHPEYEDNGNFRIQMTLPEDGNYWLYFNFSPLGDTEAVAILPMKTEGSTTVQEPHLKVTSMNKICSHNIQTEVFGTKNIDAGKLSTLVFNVSQATNQQPITTLEPYLGAFGHMAIISEDGQRYVHAHPVEVPTTGTDLAGPQVTFTAIFPQSGFYKLFAQFQTSGQIVLCDLTVEVK